jgi:hypothetical protein
LGLNDLGRNDLGQNRPDIEGTGGARAYCRGLTGLEHTTHGQDIMEGMNESYSHSSFF